METFKFRIIEFQMILHPLDGSKGSQAKWRNLFFLKPHPSMKNEGEWIRSWIFLRWGSQILWAKFGSPFTLIPKGFWRTIFWSTHRESFPQTNPKPFRRFRASNFMGWYPKLNVDHLPHGHSCGYIFPPSNPQNHHSTWICLRCLEKNTSYSPPNGGFMVTYDIKDVKTSPSTHPSSPNRLR